jgi:hypothetical protein
MMTTNHLGNEKHPRVHPVVASAARELLNKSENERSGVLSTAMSFLGLYRDPTVAEVIRCVCITDGTGLAFLKKPRDYLSEWFTESRLQLNELRWASSSGSLEYAPRCQIALIRAWCNLKVSSLIASVVSPWPVFRKS